MSLGLEGETLARHRPDVCIVGAGPIGLTLAVGLARRGVRVLVLESGLDRPNSAHQGRSDAVIEEPQHHAEMRLAVARAFGGTGWLWGGRCVPLDPVDFEPRSHVDPIGWPLSYDDVAVYHDEAAELIGCESSLFEQSPPPGLVAAGDADIRFDHLERWCERPNVGLRLKTLGFPPEVSIALGMTVVGLEVHASGGSVTALQVHTKTGRIRFKCDRIDVVLACGGLETSRLLLNVQALRPELFGGVGGPLGRFYMGHLSGKVARIRFSRPDDAHAFDYAMTEGGIGRRRIAFTSHAQKMHALPNIVFYPDNARLGDPDHRSGLLSALFLTLSTPVIGPRLISEGIRQMQMVDPPRYLMHVRNVLLDAPRAAAQIADVAWQRFGRGRRIPHIFLPSRSGEYPLHYHCEQAPSPDSRVSLTDECDATGMRRLEIRLRFTPADAEQTARAHVVLDAALRRAGIGELAFDAPVSELPGEVMRQAKDGFHQMGLTRMGKHSNDGVVDKNCCLFGFHNLFVAGSAVFRTGGQANPTFAAVALGLRLADHLTAKVKAGRRREATSREVSA